MMKKTDLGNGASFFFISSSDGHEDGGLIAMQDDVSSFGDILEYKKQTNTN